MKTKQRLSFYSFLFWISIAIWGCGHSTENEIATPNSTFPTSKNLPGSLDANGKGHGGDAVVCFNNVEIQNKVKNTLLNNVGNIHPVNPFEDPATLSNINKAQIFDIYEYQLPTGFPPKVKDLIPMSGTFLEMLPKVLSRASEKTELSAALASTLKEVPLENWKESNGVVEIDDSENAVILPSQCLLVQIAVRQENVVYYDKQLFSKLDELNRLALVMHELTYKVAVDLKQTDSRQARAASSLLLSKTEFENLNPFALNRRLLPLKDFKFPLSFANQMAWVNKVTELLPDGTPKSFSMDDKIVIDGWEMHPYHSQHSSIFLNPDHSVAKVFGRINGDGVAVFTSNNFGEIEMNGTELTCSFAGSTANLQYKNKSFKVTKAHFKDHVLVGLEAQRNSYSSLPGPYGDFQFSGKVELYPGTFKPRSVAEATIQLKYGYMYLQDAEFYESGQVKTARNAAVNPNNIEHIYATANLELVARIYYAQLDFYENGDIAAITRDGQYYEHHEITWTQGWFDDVTHIEFYIGHKPKKVTFGNKGALQHKIQIPNGKTVGPITIEFDESGKIITPL